MWQLQKDPMIKTVEGSLWPRNQDILASPADMTLNQSVFIPEPEFPHV